MCSSLCSVSTLYLEFMKKNFTLVGIILYERSATRGVNFQIQAASYEYNQCGEDAEKEPVIPH